MFDGARERRPDRARPRPQAPSAVDCFGRVGDVPLPGRDRGGRYVLLIVASTLPGFSVCAFCHGQGRVAFESGPPTEPCGACAGVGVVYQGDMLRGAFAALVADDAAFATAAQGARERFMMRALAALEERVAALEDVARPPR